MDVAWSTTMEYRLQRRPSGNGNVWRPKGPGNACDWVDCFNDRRLLEPIGNVPPVEYEQQYYQAQNAPTHGGRSHVIQSPENPGRFIAAVGGAETQLHGGDTAEVGAAGVA